MGIVENLLEVIGEHVRKMRIMSTNNVITPTRVLKMVYNSNCRNVTHLILLYRSLPPFFWLHKVVNTMPQLQHLELMLGFLGLYDQCLYHDNDDINEYCNGVEDIVALLKIIPVSVKKLNLVLSRGIDLKCVVTGIQALVNEHYALPLFINIFGEFNITATDNSANDHQWKRIQYVSSYRYVFSYHCIFSYLPANATDNLFEFWSTSAFHLPSFEIRLYDNIPIPLNLFPPVPVRSYKFGTAAAPTLIQLPSYGIVGLKDNIFHFSEYIDDHGMVSHTVTLDHDDCFGSLIEERHITSIPHLHTVSYVDISYEDVSSNHLQQLATACPNLQQLHLQGNVNCLKDLQGLQAIVDKCKNLRSLNLARIDVSLVESYLLLWDLLSSLKKLTLLTIDLCMILLYNYDDDDKQELVTICVKVVIAY